MRKSEDEVKAILNDRTHEETITELTVSIYDTERNNKAKQYKVDLVNRIRKQIFLSELNQLLKIFCCY